MNDPISHSRKSRRWFRVSPLVWALLFQGAVAITLGPGPFLSIILFVALLILHVICRQIAYAFKIDDWNIAWAIVWLTFPVTFLVSFMLK